MWHHPSSQKTQMEEHTITETKDKRWQSSDSGNLDSGFLPSGDLRFSKELSCDSGQLQVEEGGVGGIEETRIETKKVAAPVTASAVTPISESMRADSGVDLGLSESLSQLTLKQVILNPLASGKIQAEPTLELTPVSNVVVIADNEPEKYHQDCSEQQRVLNEELWQLYYTQDDDGDTQLHIAIVQGFVEAAFSLIRMAPHPCLLNILNDEWQSPLHLATLTNQPMVVRRLILAGADPSLRNLRGNTPLHLACTTGHLACAKALTDPLSSIERNDLVPGKKVPALPQNLEQRNYSGEMCLHVAASNGHVDLVRLLLRLGADLDAREALAGRTALHLALEGRCQTVIAFLLQECRPCLNTQTYAGMTAYQLALCFDSQLARELVRLGATPQPLPESDSENSEDEETSAANYIPDTITRLNMQNAVGVKV